jgi:ribosomal protein L17
MPDIQWNPKAKEIFDKVISNLPQFHRTIAQKLVKESAEELARARAASMVEEEDLVKAFFKEVPPAFKDMMKRLFTKLGINYEQYGVS